MKRAFLFLLLCPSLYAGSYAGGTGGGTAVDANRAGFVGSSVNPVFVAWATSVADYSPANDDLIDAQWKNASNALGPIETVDSGGSVSTANLVSLGDLSRSDIANGVNPGSITLYFSTAITNGAGADFAVFENAMNSLYVSGSVFVELAYVEVSTDGVNFVRFPSISTNPERPVDADYFVTETQARQYGSYDPTNIYNLAGKSVNQDENSWGTPFDLSSLLTTTEVQNGVVDLSNICYVRIVDIPGTGDYTDSQGNPIYDAWETQGSGGFDLAGVGVINAAIPEPAHAAALLLLCALLHRTGDRRRICK